MKASAFTPVAGISEAAFTAQVIALARLFGFRVAHFRPARTKTGWRTAVSGDGVGFPDTILVKGPRIIAAELKVGRNKPTPEQRKWLAALAAAGVETHEWTPADWPAIERIIMGK